MKKILSILVLCAMAVSILAACGTTPSGAVSTATSATSANTKKLSGLITLRKV